MELYRKLAEQGDAMAQFNLGQCYYYGDGVKEDKKEAVKWFRKAAEQGYAKALNNLVKCNGLTEYTIANSVTVIEDCAFKGCRGLISITIPDTVTSVGLMAFSGCSGLTSITIPNSVTEIEKNAFFGCSELIVYLSKDSSLKDEDFEGCKQIIRI